MGDALEAQPYVVFAVRGQVIETSAQGLSGMFDNKVSSESMQAGCGDKEVHESASD